MQAVSERVLHYATQHVEDFARVQAKRPESERQEAIGFLLDSLGMDENARELFEIWLKDFAPTANHGEVMLGLLIGLFCHQVYADES